MRPIASLPILLAALLQIAAPLPAAVLYVDGSGGGDYSTIDDAITAAADGDEIVVRAGVYSESIRTSKSLRLTAESGPAETILDGQGQSRLILLTGAADFSIEGFTFKNGDVSSDGAAIYARQGTVVVVDNCLFQGNSAGHDGGAVHVRNPGSSMTVRDSRFVGNSAINTGAAGSCILGATLVVEGCHVQGNSSLGVSGAFSCGDGEMHLLDTMFVRNSSLLVGAVHFFKSRGSIVGCTFAQHETGNGGTTALVHDSAMTTIERNVFFGDEGGSAIHYTIEPGQHGCNLFFANRLGSITGVSSLSPDEMEAKPLFCDARKGDFSISSDSAAAPANNECGVRLGAGEVRCGALAEGSVTLDVVPRTLNRRSQGRWIMTMVDSDVVAPAEIDPATLIDAFGATPDAVRWSDLDGDGTKELMAKFPRPHEAAVGMAVPYIVSGALHSGQEFTASTTMHVIDPGHGNQAQIDSELVVGAAATVAWPHSKGAARTPHDGYLSLDDGDTWTPLFENLVGVSSYTWIVEASPTDRAQILVESRGPRGVRHAITQIFRIRPGSSEDQNEARRRAGVDLSASPNPFNPVTNISFALDGPARVELVVYDLAGRRVRTLLSGERSAGDHTVTWFGRDDSGRRVASAVYLLRLRAGDLLTTKRVVLVK